MSEDQPRGVEEMSLGGQSQQFSTAAAAIGVVADDRMPDGGQVDANLVRAPAMEVGAEEIHRFEARQPEEIGLRGPAGRHDGDPGSVAWIAVERLLDGDLLGGEMTPGEGRVPARDLAGLQRFAERTVRAIRF